MNTTGWLAVIASALISTVLGLIAFFEGLKRIDTANAAIISTFEVVVAVALAIMILGETLTLPKILIPFCSILMKSLTFCMLLKRKKKIHHSQSSIYSPRDQFLGSRSFVQGKMAMMT